MLLKALYGREYWETHQVNRRLTLKQLEASEIGHLEREEECLQRANRYLFTDTNALTTWQFARDYHSTATPGLHHLADRCAARYDLVFLCDVDIPYADTWDRSGEVHRQVFQKRMLSDLLMRKIPFFTVRGDLKTRIGYVKQILQRFQKYQNLATCWQLADDKLSEY